MPSSTSSTPHVPMLAALLALPALSSALPQGRTEYFNVESPQVKPICVARIDGHDWLLVCNTPDNSVEIWDTDESIPAASRFKQRVRVGLEPVSVHYNSVTGRAYTADFLSDSVTAFALVPAGGTISARPALTRHVGDEPMDLAFSADGLQLFVTLHSSSAFGWRDASTLDPLAPIAPLTDMGAIDLVDSDAAPLFALKEPRAVLRQGNLLHVLGFKGGHTGAAYDFDLYTRDLGTQALTRLGTLGTTNFNMALASNGDLWIVGGEARNLTTIDEPDVADEPTGFVKSMLYRVKGAGTGLVTVLGRDLNDASGGALPVAYDKALAQPTDVIAYEPGGEVYKVYFTAFGSDRLGVLTPTGSTDPYAWPLARIGVDVSVPPPPALPNPAAGPRGLALKYANAQQTNDPGDRLYVMNRLDNSFTIVDPALDQALATIALHQDPTPGYIREGREFLYSARLSGSGFVSCASCHMDGRTDVLLWKLGTPLVSPLPYPPGLADGVPSPTEFQADKGPMMTQSLQGLLNFEVEPEVQQYFTNAPYHWRGDQFDLLGFNKAFVNLLGAPDPDLDGKGLTEEQMETFRTFVNSIHYPPNPHEPVTRVYSGDPITDPSVDPTDLGDPAGGSLAQRGLLVFHQFALELCDGRSCVQCHALPEGSNNRGTVASTDPIESAALRGLFQKEARLDKAAGPVSAVKTGNDGLIHDGSRTSINQFINRFDTSFPGVGHPGKLEVKHYTREYDWSVAPLVGRAHTVHSGNTGASETVTAIDLFEAQAGLANVGVAVHARLAGQSRGYWLDLTQGTDVYRLEGGATTLTRAALLALVVGVRDRLVFFATPLGSERRVASVGGTSAVLVGSPPSTVELRACPTNTANAQIPSFLDNWDPAPNDPAVTPFQWSGTVPTPPFLKAVRLLQHGLVTDGAGQFGLTRLRHEAPRRLSVAAHGILPGAKLRLNVPLSQTPPDPMGPLTQITTIELELPIHPTSTVLGDGRRVWQTAAEIDPLHLYAFMLGGLIAKGVRNVVNTATVGGIAEPPPVGRFDPIASNWHYVRVRNPDGQEGDGGWQRLTLE